MSRLKPLPEGTIEVWTVTQGNAGSRVPLIHYFRVQSKRDKFYNRLKRLGVRGLSVGRAAVLKTSTGYHKVNILPLQFSDNEVKDDDQQTLPGVDE